MEFLKNVGEALGGAVVGGLRNGLSGAIGSGLGALFGPSRKKLLQEQLTAQKELNKQAAELNYQYGEKAAENAYKRQLEMYERSYEDQSYQAMRKQMEEAGLSVGLMYGGSGSGGGAGQMSGAPMGATGGAQAGDATAAMGLALQYKKMAADVMLAQSQAEVNRAQANKLNTDAEDTEATRKARIENYLAEIGVKKEQAQKLFWEGRLQWIENLKTETLMEKTKEELEKELTSFGMDVVKNPHYGTTALRYGAFWTSKELENLEKIIKEGNRSEAAALFDNERKRAIWEELSIAWANANANAMVAAAKKLSAEFQTGEFVNWKNIIDTGVSVLGTIAQLAK